MWDYDIGRVNSEIEDFVKRSMNAHGIERGFVSSNPTYGGIIRGHLSGKLPYGYDYFIYSEWLCDKKRCGVYIKVVVPKTLKEEIKSKLTDPSIRYSYNCGFSYESSISEKSTELMFTCFPVNPLDMKHLFSEVFKKLGK